MTSSWSPDTLRSPSWTRLSSCRLSGDLATPLGPNLTTQTTPYLGLICWRQSKTRSVSSAKSLDLSVWIYTVQCTPSYQSPQAQYILRSSWAWVQRAVRSFDLCFIDHSHISRTQPCSWYNDQVYVRSRLQSSEELSSGDSMAGYLSKWGGWKDNRRELRGKFPFHFVDQWSLDICVDGCS